MTDDRKFILEFVAVQLVVIAALIHLSLGLFNWLRWLEAGFLVPQDVRWPLFVASGLAILVGTFVAHQRENRRPFYLAGIVLMLGYVLAYFGWHLGGHRLYLVVGPGSGGEQVIEKPIQWFLDHLFAGPIKFGTIVVEVAAAVVLAALLSLSSTDDADA